MVVVGSNHFPVTPCCWLSWNAVTWRGIERTSPSLSNGESSSSLPSGFTPPGTLSFGWRFQSSSSGPPSSGCFVRGIELSWPGLSNGIYDRVGFLPPSTTPSNNPLSQHCRKAGKLGRYRRYSDCFCYFRGRGLSNSNISRRRYD
jgi:hypothetical protein